MSPCNTDLHLGQPAHNEWPKALNLSARIQRCYPPPPPSIFHAVISCMLDSTAPQTHLVPHCQSLAVSSHSLCRSHETQCWGPQTWWWCCCPRERWSSTRSGSCWGRCQGSVGKRGYRCRGLGWSGHSRYLEERTTKKLTGQVKSEWMNNCSFWGVESWRMIWGLWHWNTIHQLMKIYKHVQAFLSNMWKKSHDKENVVRCYFVSIELWGHRE